MNDKGWDAVFFFSVGALGVGCVMISPPLGFIVPGGIVLTVCVVRDLIKTLRR